MEKYIRGEYPTESWTFFGLWCSGTCETKTTLEWAFYPRSSRDDAFGVDSNA
jgi:hypothetical protein